MPEYTLTFPNYRGSEPRTFRVENVEAARAEAQRLVDLSHRPHQNSMTQSVERSWLERIERDNGLSLPAPPPAH
jgi:hypothetical protein